MKGLFVICVLGLALTLCEARSTYKIHKNSRAKESTPEAVPGPAAVVSTKSGGDAAAVLSKTTTTTPAPVTVTGNFESELTDDSSTSAPTTKKSKFGDKPAGEPTLAPNASSPSPPAFPPKPEVESQPQAPTGESVAAESQAPPAAPETAEPATSSTAAPAPAGEAGKVVANATGTEEDDSSSEEDDEEEARILISKKKAKSLQIPVRSQPSSPPVVGNAKSPKNPPLKYDVVINGFVTEDGQVLVPFNTYEKYFRDSESPNRLPPVYAITRQDDSQPSSTSAVASEETEADKSSEDKAPASPATESSEAPAQASGSSEEVVKEAVASTESEENREKPVEQSEETKETVSTEVRNKEANAPVAARPPLNIQGRPPLQVLPARLPTDEDDEEEAGRYLDQYAYLPPFDYEDDEPISPHSGPYFPYHF